MPNKSRKEKDRKNYEEIDSSEEEINWEMEIRKSEMASAITPEKEFSVIPSTSETPINSLMNPIQKEGASLPLKKIKSFWSSLAARKPTSQLLTPSALESTRPEEGNQDIDENVKDSKVERRTPLSKSDLSLYLELSKHIHNETSSNDRTPEDEPACDLPLTTPNSAAERRKTVGSGKRKKICRHLSHKRCDVSRTRLASRRRKPAASEITKKISEVSSPVLLPLITAPASPVTRQLMIEPVSSMIPQRISEPLFPVIQHGFIEPPDLPVIQQKISGPVIRQQINEPASPVIQPQMSERVLPVIRQQMTEPVTPLPMKQITDHVSSVIRQQINEPFSPVILPQIHEPVSPVIPISEPNSPMIRQQISEPVSPLIQQRFSVPASEEMRQQLRERVSSLISQQQVPKHIPSVNSERSPEPVSSANWKPCLESITPINGELVADGGDGNRSFRKNVEMLYTFNDPLYDSIVQNCNKLYKKFGIDVPIYKATVSGVDEFIRGSEMNLNSLIDRSLIDLISIEFKPKFYDHVSYLVSSLEWYVTQAEMNIDLCSESIRLLNQNTASRYGVLTCEVRCYLHQLEVDLIPLQYNMEMARIRYSAYDRLSKCINALLHQI